MSSSILVTGGAGFIGSHFCKLLAQANKRFVVYDNLIRGNRIAVSSYDCVAGDLNNTVLLKDTILKYNVTSVVHFAALAYVRESLEKPDIYWKANVKGTLSLLTAMEATDVRSILFSSSCATYGVPKQLPITLESDQNPINPYGRTKLVCEWLIRDFAKRNNLNWLLLRYFNVAGSDPDCVIGEAHDPETHIIPILLLKAMKQEVDPVKIFGRNHPTPDGTCVRDFIHVMDLAQAHIKGLEYLEQGKPPRAFNVGLGQGTSILKLIETCERVTGKPIKHVFTDPNPGDPPTLIAEPGEVWKTLGLEPNHRDIEDMVRHAWNWIESGNRTNWLLDRDSVIRRVDSTPSQT